MPNEVKVRVTKMLRASVREDGSLIEIGFLGENGEDVLLSFAGDELDKFIGHVAQLVFQARNQMHAKFGLQGVQALRVAKAAAGSATGGDKVILSLRASRGLPYHFALSPEESANLRPQMRKAEQSAKEQASRTRQ